MLKARDAESLNHIREFEALRRHEALTVAIPYGAGHMRAVTGLRISRLHYQVVEDEWLTIITF